MTPFRRAARRPMQWMWTFFVLGAAIGGATAATAGGTTLACAAQDRKLITLIEDHGNAGDVASERLAKAFFAMMDARKTCGEGREAEAIALYESIARGLSPMRAAR